MSSRCNLFVYGTLRRGSPNRHAQALSEGSTFVGVGRVRGRLHRLQNYPGIRLNPRENRWVFGEVFRPRDPVGLFRELDRYEGAEFRRVAVDAVFADSSRMPSWIYEYVGELLE